MKEGTSVTEHVLDMMVHFNTAEVNGATIDEASQNLTKAKGKEVEANVATRKKIPRGSTSKAKAGPSKNRNVQIKKKKEKGKAPVVDKGKNVAKGICFHCNQDEHWKRNCPKYLAEKKAEKTTTGN
ncbi:uncharacterized protein LOC111025819 [Momordica charantia]|uniref:Uncharacterized protein LOC111010217 n=1 Tax=Momordica charantia TaxID=3673 RepID=A0A6J1CBU3_MOMCH|nr:uncharacterized protein LOC111010217 [Momordica charantia]XP_022159403.1 uncharacterized protein LOC111025819 [Momordica charantia]